MARVGRYLTGGERVGSSGEWGGGQRAGEEERGGREADGAAGTG